MIETEYHFSGVFDGAVFTIIREKIRFSLNATYDRLFLQAANVSYHSETHKVVSEEEIKKVFNKSRLFDFIFDTFMASPGLIIILLLAGISLTFIWGWRIAVIYFPLAFLFIGALNWLTDKIGEMIGKKAFKMEDEKTDFYNYFENDFINNYYSDINRTPFMGNVETD